MHGVHHDHPNDPMRLVMPPSVSVPLSALFYLAFYLVLGDTYALAFGAGFLGGYLLYDMTHYHLHHHKPRTRVGKRLRQLHMRHHFQDDTRGFGVSAPWWDYVFGTAPRSRRAAEPHAEALSRPVSLSPADLSAVQAEQGPVHMHVGGVLVLGGRVPRRP